MTLKTANSYGKDIWTSSPGTIKLTQALDIFIQTDYVVTTRMQHSGYFIKETFRPYMSETSLIQ